MQNTPGRNALSDADKLKIQQDIAKIKSDAKNSSKIVDENGEPLVLSHFTGDFPDMMAGGTEFTSWIVFEPTQIKSATDNIGTFDVTNPDIRLSMTTDRKTAQKESLLSQVKTLFESKQPVVDRKWVMTNRQVYQTLYRYVFPTAEFVKDMPSQREMEILNMVIESGDMSVLRRK
jgi:hypothetical protein